MKTLYFDINGTLVRDYQCKPALADGTFEREVRQAGCERLECVSNVQNTIKLLSDLGKQPDGLRIIFDMCWGAFRDADWFRRVTSVVRDPEHRALYVDLATDWWYLDDLARHYLEMEGLSDVFEANVGRRILVPSPGSNGDEILRWLANSGGSSAEIGPQSCGR